MTKVVHIVTVKLCSDNATSHGSTGRYVQQALDQAGVTNEDLVAGRVHLKFEWRSP